MGDTGIMTVLDNERNRKDYGSCFPITTHRQHVIRNLRKKSIMRKSGLHLEFELYSYFIIHENKSSDRDNDVERDSNAK